MEPHVGRRWLAGGCPEEWLGVTPLPCRRGSCEQSAAHTHAAAGGRVTTASTRAWRFPSAAGGVERPRPGVFVGCPESHVHQCTEKGQWWLDPETHVQACEVPGRGVRAPTVPGLPIQSGTQPAAPLAHWREPLPRKLQRQQCPSPPSLPRSNSLRKLDVNTAHTSLFSFSFPSPPSF